MSNVVMKVKMSPADAGRLVMSHQKLSERVKVLEAQVRWIPVSESLPAENKPVPGFSVKWIDEDFNPAGVRECFIGGDGDWISAEWFDHQDTYRNGEGTPEFWMLLPKSPDPEVAQHAAN